MRPTLFSIGSGAHAIPVHSYGFLIAIGLVIAVVLSVRRGRKIGIETSATLDLTFYAIVSGLVGARLFYVLAHAGDYAQVCAGYGAPRSLGRWLLDCTAALHFWQGGLVFLGGAVFAAAVTLLLAWRKGLGLGNVADVLAPSVSLAHVFGRLGCFLVGCCYGKPWEAGVHFPPDSVAYSELLSRRAMAEGAASTPGLHPTQIYEAAGEILIFLALLWLWRRRRFPGAVALAYAAAYGALRFIVEIFRGDTALGYLAEIRLPALARAVGLHPSEPIFLSFGQAAALALLLAATAAYALICRRIRSPQP